MKFLNIGYLLAPALLASLAVADEPEIPVTWHNPLQAVLSQSRTEPFKIEGLPWLRENRNFRRLRPNATNPDLALSRDVDNLANNPSGAQLHFKTNSRVVRVKVRVSMGSGMYHMAAAGQSGFDLYFETLDGSQPTAPRRQLFCGVSRLDPFDITYDSLLCEFPDAQMREITIHFPLYNNVETLELGLETGSQILAPVARALDKPIIVYGTSITQGAVVSRPGLAWTNMLARKRDQEVINLGFSGAGLGEAAVARRIAQIQNPGMIVLDYEANAQEGIRTSLEPFVNILRQRHPRVPIVVVSQIRWALENRYDGFVQWKAELRDFQRNFVTAQQAAGDTNIHFIDGSGFLGDDFSEASVDGIHPNDIGMQLIARNLAAALGALSL